MLYGPNRRTGVVPTLRTYCTRTYFTRIVLTVHVTRTYFTYLSLLGDSSGGGGGGKEEKNYRASELKAKELE